MTFKDAKTEKRYSDALARYTCAFHRGTPDRIPIRFFFQEAAARYAGFSNQEVALDYGRAFEAVRKMASDMDADAAMLNAIWSNYAVEKSLGLKYFHIPGVDLPLRGMMQYSEPSREEDQYLREDEYDEFISDPTQFVLGKWLSRASDRVAAPGSPVTADHNTALISWALAYGEYMAAFGPAADRLKYESGIVSANSGMVKAPFDILADKFRGYTGLCIDCFERPELVYKACEALMPHVLENAVAGADPTRTVPITLWAHRGCVPFVTYETFDRIYFATLKPVLEELAARGYQVIFYGEGCWEPHYDALLTLPEDSIIYHIDRGDPAKAVRLKEKFALSGGLSYDLLARGSAHEVYAHTAGLIELLGRDGGYMLDASALMLDGVKPENVRAAADCVLERGVYSSGSLPPPARATTERRAMPPFPDATPPGCCRTWEKERAAYSRLAGDAGLVKREWKKADARAYNIAWTTVLW